MARIESKIPTLGRRLNLTKKPIPYNQNFIKNKVYIIGSIISSQYGKKVKFDNRSR